MQEQISLSGKAGIPTRYLNRHCLITGATGTGKTVSLMRLAEQCARQGIPVFTADIKGDLSALARSCMVRFLDPFGQGKGDAVAVPVASFGAPALARICGLSPIQSDALAIVFQVAGAIGAPLETLSDLRAVLRTMGTTAGLRDSDFGHVSRGTIGILQRTVTALETDGAASLFRAPCFDVADLLAPRVSVLTADRLIQSPRTYAAFLFWLLSDLYERLPEVGDLDAPRLVFIFDEAHLLFEDAPRALVDKLAQMARLIRSKGVGVVFASQSADDIPDTIRAQLATRIEHSRELPIGTARVRTLDQAGRPVDAGAVPIDMPDCPLGALEEGERPMPAPIDQADTPRAPWAAMGKSEAALLGVILALVGAAGFGALTAWQSGSAGKLAVIAVAIIAAGLARR
ncbi:conjugal transfer ATPase TrbE [Hartmannibacter diazotrophicus]|uniref:Conjugal transfer ATPase TrbE n=1 Tax=Hartmannibacter diazotrophicus TaxID=1482074 RepID=A0A2C9D3B3_9HYPH|nr:helicase HerA-like domain-containing protein [Hartmannibacter diazotrophicus]SON54271.1 conjugal transfer ATPase TrbE [Hartmannibacter diazotrophicus]